MIISGSGFHVDLHHFMWSEYKIISMRIHQSGAVPLFNLFGIAVWS